MQRRGTYIVAGVCIILAVAGVAIGFRTKDSSSTQPLSVPAPERPAREVPPGWSEYTNEQYLFSVLYPDGIVVTELPREDVMTVTFEDTKTTTGFQVFILPYAEPTISEERFLKDIPLGVREEEEKVFVDSVEAVQFWSNNSVLGDTREVWFIKKPYLYEVTTLKPLDPFIQEILKTWKFL